MTSAADQIVPTTARPARVVAERVQTGVRIEKRILKVTKGLAEYLDISLGDLLEGVLLHVFDGSAPFSAATLGRIRMLREVYGLELPAADAHRMAEPKNEAYG